MALVNESEDETMKSNNFVLWLAKATNGFQQETVSYTLLVLNKW